MKKKILLIHPGYGKAGTTSFQHLLQFLNVNILAKPTENQTKTIWFKLFKERLFENRYEINKKEYNYYELRNDFKNYLKNFFNNQNKISVYSDEGLLGGIKNRGNNLGLYNLVIFKEIIEEIENELNIKIIVKFAITIRRQYDMILSAYHYLEEYYQRETLTELFKRTIQSEEYKNLFAYTILLKKIVKIFDSEILILPLELLNKDQDEYVAKICNFIELDAVVKHKLKQSNKNYIIKNGKKSYFYKSSPFSRIFYLATIIHQWLKKIEIYKNNYKNITLFKFIYKIVKPKEKKVLNKESTEFFQNEIKNLYKNDNLELEKINNINLRNLDYF